MEGNKFTPELLILFFWQYFHWFRHMHFKKNTTVVVCGKYFGQHPMNTKLLQTTSDFCKHLVIKCIVAIKIYWEGHTQTSVSINRLNIKIWK